MLLEQIDYNLEKIMPEIEKKYQVTLEKYLKEKFMNAFSEIIDEKTFNMTIKTEGGLYIKELISGDGGRSQPNVSEILGVNAVCSQLDVLEVSEK